MSQCFITSFLFPQNSKILGKKKKKEERAEDACSYHFDPGGET